MHRSRVAARSIRPIGGAEIRQITVMPSYLLLSSGAFQNLESPGVFGSKEQIAPERTCDALKSRPYCPVMSVVSATIRRDTLRTLRRWILPNLPSAPASHEMSTARLSRLFSGAVFVSER